MVRWLIPYGFSCLHASYNFMSMQASPVSSFHSDARTAPPSPNHFFGASPNQSVQQPGLTVFGNENTIPNRVLIGKDATKEPSDISLVWALKNLIKPGDSITVVGFLHHINTPMGYKSQANMSDFNGTNKLALESEMSQKLVHFEDKFRPLADTCDKLGVFLDITITAGAPMKAILVKEAVKLKVTHVLLDRNLRRDRKYYKEHLECNVIAISEKNQVEHVRESSVAYMLENAGLPLPKLPSTASSMPSSPNSVATSFTCDGISIPSSDSSNNKGDPRASTQSLVSIREDVPCKSFSDIDMHRDRRFEQSCDYLPEAESCQSISSSASHSRENSFIDLFMLSSPDGIMPVWSSANVNEMDSSCACENSIDQSMPKMGMQLSTNSVSSVSTCPSDELQMGSAPSTSLSSNQMPLKSLQKDIISVQPRRHFPQLNDLIKAHKCQIDKDLDKEKAEGKLGASFLSEPLESDQAQPLGNNASDYAADDCTEKHKSYKLIDEVEDTDSVLGKNLAQAPPLCSICKLTSMELGRSPKVYEWAELKAATNDFASENLIAEGGFSFVYKGTLQGQVVAIKKLKSSSLQGDVQFSAEVEALSCAQHRNLVRLLGYGVKSYDRALVYEYVCNGSLDQHLSGHNGGVMDWPSRYKIAIGAARGLRYLHEECRVGCIVHRDMRPNNILVTHDFVAMVGDFGLAKLNSNVDAAVETQVVGSLGFLAPEYVDCGQVTSKIDVYSFGVVLLELISGRKAIDLQRPKGEISLIEWARQKLHHHRIHELVDQRIADALDMYELNRMVKAAALCIKKDPRSRPGMSQVLRILEGDAYESSFDSLQDIFPVTLPANMSKSLDELRQPVDRLQLLNTASKRVSTAAQSWRAWVRNS